MKDETLFETVTYDPQTEGYRADNGAEVRFPRMLHLEFEGVPLDIKLSYSRERDGEPTSKPVPCIRLDDIKLFLDDERLVIASDCVIPVRT